MSAAAGRGGLRSRSRAGWCVCCLRGRGMLRRRKFSELFRVVAIACAVMAGPSMIQHVAHAEVVPAPLEIPPMLTLDESIRMLRTRGLDTLIAEAAVMNAEGQATAAGAFINPSVTLGYGRVLDYNANQVCAEAGTPAMPATATTPAVPAMPATGCSANQYSIGLSDQNAIVDILSGKHSLRKSVAERALQAAKMTRNDALRQLEVQVKQTYFQIVEARDALDFAKQTAESANETLEKHRTKYKLGAIDDSILARVETTKLEADQQVDLALQSLRTSRLALAFLLGARGHVPDFDVEKDVLQFSVPPLLNTPDEQSLVRQAFEHRADLRAQSYQRERAEAQISLAKRLRFPDVGVSVQYTQVGTGQNSIQPPTISVAITSGLPVFYQQQGEIRQAEADYNTQDLQRAKIQAQIVNDVQTAFASYMSTRRLVERMTGSLLERAKTARDLTKLQYEKGAISYLESLDAQRTFIATNAEYLQDLTNYWTAVAQLEAAVGMELRK
jgi:cobalt-zinc-cadmium efflux system outer membrane protein